MLPSDDELRDRQRRIGWWLLVARLAAGKTQLDAALAVGLTSASSYGDFERAETPPSLRQLAVLAAFFEVPLTLFAEAPATDEERLEGTTGRRSLRTAEEDDASKQRTGTE